MDALISKKTSLLSLKEKLSVNEQKIRSQMGCVMSQLSEIEELISAQSALDEKVSALLSSAPPKKRGPKKLSEMTTEERAEHDAAVAARAESRKAAHSEATSSDSVSGSDSEEKKKKYKSWTPWALENEFKTDDLFYVTYKGLTTTLTGLWSDDAKTYYLCSPLIAPIPEGWTAEKGQKHGYGVPIKWDAPTHAAALVKAAHGAPIRQYKNGTDHKGPDAGPADVKIRMGDKMVSVYEIKAPEVVVA